MARVYRNAENGGIFIRLVLVLFVVLLAAGAGYLVMRREDEARKSCEQRLQEQREAHTQEIQKLHGDWSRRVAALREQLDRYRANPDLWQTFAAFDEAVRARSIRARIDIHWVSTFSMEGELYAGETLLGGRSTNETREAMSRSRNSPGFLLGRRSNFVFALLFLGEDDPALNGPYWLPATPRRVEIERVGFNRFANYHRSGTGASLEVQGLKECSGPASIVHAWKGPFFTGLVVGCEVPDGPDIPLFQYEDFSLWTRLTAKHIAFPSMTYDGGVSLAWQYLDRKYGEDGIISEGMGLPGSVSVTFLPLEVSREPVLHSVIFQLNEGVQVWMPFWSIKKQLAAAQDIFAADQLIKLSTDEADVRILNQGALDPILRKKMLRSFQNLMNMATPYLPVEEETPSPEVTAGVPAV